MAKKRESIHEQADRAKWEACSEFVQLLEGLAHQFEAAAMVHPGVQAVLCVNTTGLGDIPHGQMPGLTPVPPGEPPKLIVLADGSSRRPIASLVPLQGKCHWDSIEWHGFPFRQTRSGPPAITFPPKAEHWHFDRVMWRKPRNYFFADHTLIETFVIWPVGPDSGWERFIEVAEVAIRTVGEDPHRLPKALHEPIYRLAQMVVTSPPALWVLLCFQLAWDNVLAPTVVAPRRTWAESVVVGWEQRSTEQACPN